MGIELTNGPYLKKKLLGLPSSEWTEETKWWDSILVVPTQKRHDSGYACIALIGVKDGQAEEIVGYPDDISFPAFSGIPNYTGTPYSDLRMDCYWPSGVLHLWSRHYEFSAGWTSSSDIELREKSNR